MANTRKNKAKKITDKQFFALLRENSGLFARTAKAIQDQFNIDYTRQSVRVRALNNPEELADIEEENIDVAEEGLHSLMKSKNESIKLKAINVYLRAKAKPRGYVDRRELVGRDGESLFNNINDEKAAEIAEKLGNANA